MLSTNGQITVRSPTEIDAENIVAAVLISLETLGPSFLWARPDLSEHQVKKWMRKANRAGDEPFTVLDELGCVIGGGEVKIDPENSTIRFWTREDKQRQGVGTSVVELATKWVFANRDVKKLRIFAAVNGSAAPRRVAEKLGAEYEGVLEKYLTLNGVKHDAHSYVLHAN